ncbi:MAG: hypothetical protein CENE_01752 [Candidatus Celerinatantimonas neptuna]|nr:MAG: hypothetical protein CENE_01752 [Candidatus Celerinatantimonas neptuna]
MTRYQNFLSIIVSHRYFTPVVTHNLQFEWAPTSHHWLNQQNMLVKPILGGICILSDQNNPPELGDNRTLNLKIFSPDPLFRNYTKAPDPKILYTTYFATDLTQPDNTLSIHPDRWLSAEQLLKLAENQQIPPFHPRELNQNLVGYLKLQLSQQRSEKAQRVVTLNYQASQGYWRYYFSDNYIDEHCSISDIQQQHTFQYTGKTNLTGFGPATVFQSDQPLYLAKKSPYHFQLKKNNQILIRHLPAASPNNLTRDNTPTENAINYDIYLS